MRYTTFIPDQNDIHAANHLGTGSEQTRSQRAVSRIGTPRDCSRYLCGSEPHGGVHEQEDRNTSGHGLCCADRNFTATLMVARIRTKPAQACTGRPRIETATSCSTRGIGAWPDRKRDQNPIEGYERQDRNLMDGTRTQAHGSKRLQPRVRLLGSEKDLGTRAADERIAKAVTRPCHRRTDRKSSYAPVPPATDRNTVMNVVR